MTQPYQPQPQPVQMEQPPKKKRRLLWIGIVLAILWLASCGAIIGAIVGEDEDPATTASPPSSAPTVVTTAPPVDETTTAPEPEPECDRLSKADLKAVGFAARNKKIDISAGVALPLPEELQEFNGLTFTRVIALNVITADDHEAIPIFAAHDDLIEFIGVNKDAMKHFHTLAGSTTKSGTPIQEYRDQVLDSDVVTQLMSACV
jgi:hypothetical protein